MMAITRSAPKGVVRRLTLFYGAALILLALIVLSYAVARAYFIQPPLDRAVEGVKLAGRENADGQEIGKAASDLLLTPDRGTQSVYIVELQQVLPAMQQDYRDLPGFVNENPDAAALLTSTQPHYQTLVLAVNQLLAVNDAEQNDISSQRILALQPYVVTILADDEPFSYTMQQLAEQSDSRVESIQTLEGGLDKGLIGLTWVALLVVGLFVFRPATRRVGLSMQELVRAEEQQRELAALKDQFIVDANHELRTPIMSLYNNLELLEAVGQDGEAEERSDLLRRALNSGDMVLRLLTNVLDTSALESRAPRLSLQELPLAALVRAVLETFDPREIGEPGLALSAYQTRAVTIDIAADLVVLGDEVRLRQVLTNLVANALKYSEPETPIQIGANLYIEDHAPHGGLLQHFVSDNTPNTKFVMVRVRDFGLGVPARDVSKLFNRFVRLERDIAGSVRGTGVGLFVSRILVEAMGGRIWVESAGVPGEGSTFCFTIPLAAPLALDEGMLEPVARDSVLANATGAEEYGDPANHHDN